MFLSNKSIVGLNYLANVRFSAASETNVPKSPKNRTYLLGPVPACKYISIWPAEQPYDFKHLYL